MAKAWKDEIFRPIAPFSDTSPSIKRGLSWSSPIDGELEGGMNRLRNMSGNMVNCTALRFHVK
jgi:hypothetical protein